MNSEKIRIVPEKENTFQLVFEEPLTVSAFISEYIRMTDAVKVNVHTYVETDGEQAGEYWKNEYWRDGSSHSGWMCNGPDWFLKPVVVTDASGHIDGNTADITLHCGTVTETKEEKPQRSRKMNGTERTRMTAGMLKESLSILQKLTEACTECLDGSVAWSEACRAKGLDLLKARAVVLGLHKCVSTAVQLSKVDDEALDIQEYDAFELFYRAVFGDMMMDRTNLPHDYKETVLYVLDSTGLEEPYADVLRLHFGMGENTEAHTLEEVGRFLGKSRERARQTVVQGMRLCRKPERSRIMKDGLALWTLKQELAEAEHKLKVEAAEAERDAAVARIKAEHEDVMDKIAHGQDTLSIMLRNDLQNMTPDSLDMSVRATNALRRDSKSPKTVLELLKNADMESLLKIRNLGRISAEEVLEILSGLLRKKYGITIEQAREICFPEGIAKEKQESYSWPVPQ